MTAGFVFFGEKFTLDSYIFDLMTAGSAEKEYRYMPNKQTALIIPDVLENNSDSAEIVESVDRPDGKSLKANLYMEPFELVKEDIELTRDNESILYTAVNTNKLRYLDKFDCVWPRKMKINILLMRDGDNWILYGIGGVNAPRVPFFTERIQTSFINRINTFCSFIFKKF